MNPLDYAKTIAYSSEQTLMFSYNMAKKYQDSKGDYVETGVAAGAQIIAMAYGAPRKTVWAFDSFVGLPLPSNRDDQMPGIKMLTKYERSQLPDPGKQALVSTGAVAVSLVDFWKNIETAFGSKHQMQIVSMKGWFEDTVKGFEPAISILRLDGDLYNSTWVCLQHLFPKLIKGGVCIIDDWNLVGCEAACREYFDLIGYEPNYEFISDIAYFFK